jgi:hypothetical protein
MGSAAEGKKALREIWNEKWVRTLVLSKCTSTHSKLVPYTFLQFLLRSALVVFLSSVHHGAPKEATHSMTYLLHYCLLLSIKNLSCRNYLLVFGVGFVVETNETTDTAADTNNTCCNDDSYNKEEELEKHSTSTRREATIMIMMIPATTLPPAPSRWTMVGPAVIVVCGKNQATGEGCTP